MDNEAPTTTMTTASPKTDQKQKKGLVSYSQDVLPSLTQTLQERTSSLEQSLSLIRAMLESSSEGIIVINEQGNLIEFNQKFIQLWNINVDALKAGTLFPLFDHMQSCLQDPRDLQSILHRIDHQPDDIDQGQLRLRNGQIYDYDSQPHRVGNQILGRRWSFRDFTHRYLLERQLQYQATHDSLTNLPNRVLLIDHLENIISDFPKNRKSTGVLLINLDRFKWFNDSYSHAVGDKLLQHFVQKVQFYASTKELFARTGGDEFVMLVPQLTTENQLKIIAQNILQELRTPFMVADQEFILSASIGIAIHPRDGETTDELLSHADLALYYVKERGGNQIHFYTSDLARPSHHWVTQEIEIRHGLARGEFCLHYQPQFDLRTEELIGAEVLIRWMHPQQGLIPPSDFIPLAEETGLIISLGEWVLRSACQQNKRWQEQGFKPICLSVNVATSQFKQLNFVRTVETILQENGLDPQFLEIEVTENVVMDNETILQTLQQLKDMGIRIALDDFGVGNASINCLKKLPLDRLKIDKSFIENIDQNSSDAVIMKAILAMSTSLNLEVIVEGVEKRHQLDFLKSEACVGIQGFYFSKPLVVEDMEAILREHYDHSFLKEAN